MLKVNLTLISKPLGLTIQRNYFSDFFFNKGVLHQ